MVEILIADDYIERVSKLIGSNKSIEEHAKISGKDFLFTFRSFKDEEAIFITGTETKETEEIEQLKAKIAELEKELGMNKKTAKKKVLPIKSSKSNTPNNSVKKTKK